MAFEDDPRDIDYHKPPPECPYWGDGKHAWYSDDTPDYRYTNTPIITLKCKCGATREKYD